jgi:hypothetical protein
MQAGDQISLTRRNLARRQCSRNEGEAKRSCGFVSYQVIAEPRDRIKGSILKGYLKISWRSKLGPWKSVGKAGGG